MGLTEATALVAAVVGTAGLVLGVINYLRDRPRIVVSLTWDMKSTDPRHAPKKLWGIVTVANAGRRPIFISHASLKLPKGYAHSHLLLSEGIEGKRLGEGDPPAMFMIDQDGMEAYAKNWPKIRAVVYDTASKEYRSPRPDKSKPPSWAIK